MKLTLAIDTTGAGGSVALADDGRLVARVDHDLARGYAESLFSLFDAALERAGATRDDLFRVAVVEGPGSFTGLRVGVMTAKTLSRARGWGLWTANALELSLPPLVDAEAEVRVAVPAGRGHVWTAVYHPGDQGWTPRSEIERAAVAEVEDLAREQGMELVWSPNQAGAATSSKRSLAERLALAADGGTWPAREVDPRTLVPLYTAPSQAERAHGLDLGEAIHRPQRPVSWD